MRKDSDVGDMRCDDRSQREEMSEPQEGVPGDGVPQTLRSGRGRRNLLGSLGATGLAVLAGLGFGELSAAAKRGPATAERRRSGNGRPRGKRGEAGPGGPAGSPGSPGEKGDKGDTGAQGDTGPQGATGASGVAPRGTLICNYLGGGNQCSGYDDCPAPFTLCVREGGPGGFSTNGICCRLS